MVLVGFWHGAGWTFIAWGCYHGVLLALAHFYKQSAFNQVSQLAINKRAKLKPLFWALTFFAVVCGWVLFRATSFQVAASVLSGMFFMNGLLQATPIMTYSTLTLTMDLYQSVYHSVNASQLISTTAHSV